MRRGEEAQRVTPDMFYVNEFADRFKSHDPDKFQQLFGLRRLAGVSEAGACCRNPEPSEGSIPLPRAVRLAHVSIVR